MNIDGSHAVGPVSESDACPISNPEDYIPEQHDCPLPCLDFSNVHSWTPFLSVNRLQRCQEPMLLQFTITQPLDDPASDIYIRACTLNVSGSNSTLPTELQLPRVNNPKKDTSLVDGGSLTSAPACSRGPVRQVEGQLQLLASKEPNLNGTRNQLAFLFQGMGHFFADKDNCDESYLFAHHKQNVAAIYVGAKLSKSTARSALESFTSMLDDPSNLAYHVLAEFCESNQDPDRNMGIAFSSTASDLALMQKRALRWSQGQCASKDDGLVRLRASPSINVTLHNSSNNSRSSNETWSASGGLASRLLRRNSAHRRDVCRHIEVAQGDSCASLASRCAISGPDFTKFNSDKDFCSSLQPGDFACCSSGTPYTPTKPEKNADGTCAVHLIKNGDSCSSLAKKNGIKVDDIEKWNKGKTWAWNGCAEMLAGYNMCLSPGFPPLPPPQQGTECGPIVPGTKPPKDKKTSLADLNPCPLKACCSNWGFCGVFPGHCDIHAPKGGGPGTKEKGFQNTCISNCETKIKQNSGPPEAFGRIGYYESFGLARECLVLKPKHANTDGTYTHIHWGFASIEPNTWKPIVNNSQGQWDEFKKLKDVKKILSFGGWAYSTEADTSQILRSAIIENRNTFASNLAKFAQDEGIDGIDIDWEYPGAPDIYAGGQLIGKKGDGIAYLKFLTVLKESLGKEKSVSIAAPASFWYLKAFPIDRIAAVIDYIVFMTYDLHGQWDYGNSNAFDACDSGKCIRSHVNLTETSNALSIITKAGVPNNKIFVGESSYGRSFRMAQEGCWGPMCEFTGSREQSNANPGRCTKTSGYIANAEINEIIKSGRGRTFHDGDSNTDVLLYDGDYVSYMTPTTKDTRREDWRKLNFAGSIDWAVDLQEFTSDDFALPEQSNEDRTCVSGSDIGLDSGSLCEFSCGYGFCPKSRCRCESRGKPAKLPKADDSIEASALDVFDVDMNRLCKFACKYGYCPEDQCEKQDNRGQGGDDKNDASPDDDGVVHVGDPGVFDYRDARWANEQSCMIHKDSSLNEADRVHCLKVCKPVLDEAGEDETKNAGCVPATPFPLDKPIPWQKSPFDDGDEVVRGQCNCNNWLVNEIANFVLDAMPIIAQIGCYVLMSAVHLVLDAGAGFVPGAGKVLEPGLNMAATAAQMASYIYPKGEAPEEAFSWWLSPCGSTDMVPDDIKTVFDILNSISGDATNFRKPKNIKKGSGKKGDDGNPRGRVRRPNTGGSGKAPKTPSKGGGKGGGSKKKKCNIPKGQEKTDRRNGNTLRILHCPNDQAKTQTEELIITTATYKPNAQPTLIEKECRSTWGQACYHYSSAIRNNPAWSTLVCPQEAATNTFRHDAKATTVWKAEHDGPGWEAASKANRQEPNCDMDEYPPAKLLGFQHPARLHAGATRQGQRTRLLPASENRGAGSMWRGICLHNALDSLSDADFRKAVERSSTNGVAKSGNKQKFGSATVSVHPRFTISSWKHGNARDDGLWDNKCWPKGIASNDPGFTLLTLDEWYDNNARGPNGRSTQWDYTAKFVLGTNGG